MSSNLKEDQLNKQRQKEIQLRIAIYLGGPVFIVIGFSLLEASRLATTDVGIAIILSSMVLFGLAGILLCITIIDLATRIKNKIGR